MAKPTILSVDDDPQVLAAVSRDLRRQYGEGYRVVRAESGEAALEALRDLHSRGDPVALFLVDQRMPRMNGVEFLTEAAALYPDAKRVMLTAYADTDAAISAINQSRIHYYLLKPWDPPETQLYPVLDDLLDDWRADYRPPFTGLRIVGTRWSAEGYTLRDFLARHGVPYRWLDLEGGGEAGSEAADLAGGAAPSDLPLVVLEDGTRLSRPSTGEVAQRAGLRTQAENSFYDLVIVGAGPAGLAAAVYGASEGLKVALLDRDAPGGQAGTSSRIENYLGFPVGLSGADLTRRGVAQARKFGAEIIAPQGVERLDLRDDYKVLTLTAGKPVSCHALVVATGVSYRKLDLPGAEALTGAGVYYGSSNSEAASYAGETVHIVGAGNSAGQAAMYLSRYAASVTLLVRGSSLEAKMSQYLVEQLRSAENIHVMLGGEVAEVHGDTHLEALTLTCNGNRLHAPSSGLFIFIGASPRTDWLGGVVARDRYGFLYTGLDFSRTADGAPAWSLKRPPFLLETSVPGVFAAGDVRAGSVKRVASAVGEGSIAVQFIHQYLAEVGA
ncbi:MAG: Thioredoxin reductase [uncultured Truepera sp.]|uniref:Thioredoxin reductase n=1 Tax=uncultured Truepera sp. TaxID=543023 RepID=A0A6J4UQA0_9DEIN|nr:MAG: Thioredoxin reductase [uncultured Truepera sp.]